MHALTPFAASLALSLSASVETGGEPEWGGFRGNNGAGVGVSEAIPEALDPEQNVLWRSEVPPGYSSPVVSGERVFLTGSEEQELIMLCLSRTNGEELWRHTIEFDGLRPGANSPASPSPVTDGERVYFVFHHVGLVACDMQGEQLWRKNVGPFKIPHGMSTSPLVHGDLVVLLVDQDQGAFLAAYDAASGEERWKVARSGVTHTYSTPSLYLPSEGPAQVIVSGSYQIAGYDLASGEKEWWVDGGAWQTKAVPLVDGDRCFVNTYMIAPSEFGTPKLTQTWEEALAERDANGDGAINRGEWESPIMQQVWFIFDLDDNGVLDQPDYEYLKGCDDATGGCFAIRLGGEGDVTESHVLWTYDDRRGLPDAPSPLLYGDLLYMVKEGGIMTALDPATGEVVRQGRLGVQDQFYASPVAAAGRIVTASQSGQLCVVDGSSEGDEWSVLSTTDLGEIVWSTPAIVGNQVLVRSQDALYCFQDVE